MSESVREHRSRGAGSHRVAVLTVSDTRTVETDTSGALIVELLQGAGHEVADRRIVPDEPDVMRPVLDAWNSQPEIEAVLITGGTGISPRDQTFETVSSVLTRPLPGYGELFRMLSYAEIGPACLLSRAVGGLRGAQVILVMPGSRAAVQLAMSKIILPELGHLIGEANKR